MCIYGVDFGRKQSYTQNIVEDIIKKIQATLREVDAIKYHADTQITSLDQILQIHHPMRKVRDLVKKLSQEEIQCRRQRRMTRRAVDLIEELDAAMADLRHTDLLVRLAS